MAIVGGKNPGKDKPEDKDKKPLLPLSMQAQRDIAKWNEQEKEEIKKINEENGVGEHHDEGEEK